MGKRMILGPLRGFSCVSYKQHVRNCAIKIDLKPLEAARAQLQLLIA